MTAAVQGEKGFYGWVNIAVTSVMGVAGGLYLISFGVFLPYLVEHFGWDRSLISLGSTVNLIVMGICGPLAGAYIARHGARRSIVIGNFLGFLGFLLLFAHTNLWQLFAGFGLLIGLGVGFGGLLASTTVINDWFVQKRALALSVYLGSFGAGGIVIGPSMVALIENIGWRKTYLLLAVVILACNVILPAILIRNKPADLGQVPDGPDAVASGRKPVPLKAAYKTPVDFTMQEALRTRTLWFLIIYFCFNMLAMQALFVHQFAYLKDEIGILPTQASFALSAMSVVMTLTQYAVGMFLGSRYSMHAIAVASEILKILGMIMLVFTTTLPFVFVYMVIFGFGFGGAMVATMNIFPNYFGASDYPRIMGFTRMFWTFAGGAGAPLAGLVWDRTGSYLPAFRTAIFLIAAGLIFLVFAKSPVHPSLQKSRSGEALAEAAE
ncbi:MAG: MFS transporter [Acidobacteria bacterium]|nr:MFS transporter [Acidobacteriota bacterium]